MSILTSIVNMFHKILLHWNNVAFNTTKQTYTCYWCHNMSPIELAYLILNIISCMYCYNV